ncbi:MAG: cadherin-like domain-containing protein [Terricaulis sp.]
MTGNIFLAVPEVSVSEADSAVLVTFERTGDLSGAVTITYGVTEENADEGADYIGPSGTVVLEAGQARVSVPITILNDAFGEPTETFVVSLIHVDNGFIEAPRTLRVSILDDEIPIIDPPEPPAVSNYNVSMQEVLSGLNAPIKLEFSQTNPSLAYVAEKGGVIKCFDITTGAQLSVFLDLSAQVNDIQDRGLMDIAFHPDFANNPYFYAFFIVDPAGTAGQSGNAGADGGGNRYAYVERFTADPATNFTTIVPGSGVVIVGQTGQTLGDINGGGAIDSTEPANVGLAASDQYLNPNAATPPTVIDGFKQNYIKVDSLSHAGGSLAFGPDGALYVGIGDGTSFNFADPRTANVQNLNSLSGKIIRIDPLTGQGLADNPFVEPGMSLDTNAAKVFQLGIRNPFSMGFTQDGRLFMTETGWNSYEEINSGLPGANFGWPYYEGGDAGVLRTTTIYRDLPSASAFYEAVANGDIVVTPAFRSWAHSSGDPGYQFQAITGGDVVYTGDKYPVAFLNNFFFTDFSDGEIFSVDTNNRQEVEFLYKIPGGFGPTDYKQGPDGYVYYVDLVTGHVGRLIISPPPIDPGAVTLSGSAAQTGPGEYVLTTTGGQTGAVTSSARLDLRADFSISFQILLGQNDGGGDGAGFVLHNDPGGAGVMGEGGSGLGLNYIINGLGIAFDTYANTEFGEINNDSTSFVDTGTGVRTAPVDLGNVEDGIYRQVVVTWDAETSTLSYTINGVLAGVLTDPNFTQTYFAGSEFVHFGFTGSTGGAFNDQRVRVGAINATYEGVAANHVPVAVDDAFDGSVNTPIILTGTALTANDTDADHDVLGVASVGNATHGTVSLVNGVITFTPAADYVGLATFDYLASDGHTGVDTGRVTLDIRAVTPAAMTLVGSAASGAASGEYVLTTTGGQTGAVTSTGRLDIRNDFSISFQILLGQNEGGGDGAGFVLHNAPGGAGAIGETGGGLGLNAIQNGLGIVFDTYSNSELGEINNDSTSFVRTSTGVRTAPVDLGNVEDGLYRQVIVTWDADTSTLRYTINGVLVGTLTDANIAADYFGGSNFVHFGFTGATGGAFNDQRVKIGAVSATFEGGGATNHAPVAVDDLFVGSANTPFTLASAALTGNDTDADSNPLLVSSVSNAAHGTVSLVNGLVTFTPTAGYVGLASFDYAVSDGHAGADTGTVTLSVRAVTPTAVTLVGSAANGASAGEYVLTTTGGQTGAVNSSGLIDVRANFTISFAILLGQNDGGGDGAGFVLQAGAANAIGQTGGGLGLNGIANGLGIVFDTYSNSEFGEINNDSTSFMRTATGVRTAPVDLGNVEDGAYRQVTVSWDAATHTLSYSINGVVMGVLTDANLAANYFGGASLVHFGFTGATGGAFNEQRVRIGAVDATFGVINHDPVAGDDSAIANFNTPLVINAATLLANDTDSDGHTVAITSVSGAVNGSVSFASGQVTFTPTANFVGAASFTYAVNDGHGGADTAVVSINVRPSPVPVAVADTYALDEDTSFASSSTRNVLANDTDSDTANNLLTASLVTGPAHGTLSLTSNGRFTYSPAANFSGTDTFTYRASDGTNQSAPATVTITVRPVNDPPVLTYNNGQNTTITILENTSPLLAQVGATDIDGDTISYSLTGADAARFSVGANGVIRFLAAPNFESPTDADANNAYIFTVEARDPGGRTDTQQLTIRVTDVAESAVINGTTGNDTNLRGTANSDILQGNAGADTVSGLDGNDTFRATASDGNDTYSGGAGLDTVDFSAISVAVTINLNTNSAQSTSTGTDTLSAIENAIGGSGADTIIGNASVNRLQGGAGNDVLTGNAGADAFVFTPGFSTDRITDFADASTGDQDMLDLSAFGFANVASVLSHATQVGADTIIDVSATDHLILSSFTLVNLGADDLLL